MVAFPVRSVTLVPPAEIREPLIVLVPPPNEVSPVTYTMPFMVVLPEIFKFPYTTIVAKLPKELKTPPVRSGLPILTRLPVKLVFVFPMFAFVPSSSI